MRLPFSQPHRDPNMANVPNYLNASSGWSSTGISDLIDLLTVLQFTYRTLRTVDQFSVSCLASRLRVDGALRRLEYLANEGTLGFRSI